MFIYDVRPFDSISVGISLLFCQESKQRKGGREYFFDLKKKEEGFWPRLLKDSKKVFCALEFLSWFGLFHSIRIPKWFHLVFLISYTALCSACGKFLL